MRVNEIETFQSDTVFKRAFFRSITILGGNLTSQTLSVSGEEVLDFTKAGKSLRSAKYEEHLSLKLPSSLKHTKKVFDVLAQKDKNVKIIGDQLDQKTADLKIQNPESDLKTEKLDHLYNQLLLALEEKNETKIQKLQETILLLSDEP